MSEARCQSCGRRLDQHLGLFGVCRLLLSIKGELIAIHSLMAEMPEFADSEFRKRLARSIERIESDEPEIRKQVD